MPLRWRAASGSAWDQFKLVFESPGQRRQLRIRDPSESSTTCQPPITVGRWPAAPARAPDAHHDELTCMYVQVERWTQFWRERRRVPGQPLRITSMA